MTEGEVCRDSQPMVCGKDKLQVGRCGYAVFSRGVSLIRRMQQIVRA